MITTIIYPKNTNKTYSFLTLKMKIKLKIAVGNKYLNNFNQKSTIISLDAAAPSSTFCVSLPVPIF